MLHYASTSILRQVCAPNTKTISAFSSNQPRFLPRPPFRRTSKFPLSYGAGATTKRDRSLPASQAPRSDKRKEKEQARPALQLLNTKWLCVGELSSSSEAQGDLVEVDAEAAAAVAAEEGLIRSSSLRPAQKQEVVWLLAGHTEKSYAEISEVVSVEGCTGALGETQRENLAHMLTLGPGAAGGAPAAMGRLKRYACDVRASRWRTSSTTRKHVLFLRQSYHLHSVRHPRAS